jgi:hypothetical protein
LIGEHARAVVDQHAGNLRRRGERTFGGVHQVEVAVVVEVLGDHHLRIEVRDVEVRVRRGEYAGAVVEEEVLRLCAARSIAASVREEDVLVTVAIDVGEFDAVGPNVLRRERSRVVGELLREE